MGGAIASPPLRLRRSRSSIAAQKLAQTDIEQLALKAAAAAAGVAELTMPPAGPPPRPARANESVQIDEDHFHALAAAMSKEHRAIVVAGILAQIDVPFLPDTSTKSASTTRKKSAAQIDVEVINTALKASADDARFPELLRHQRRPRIYEAALDDIIDYSSRSTPASTASRRPIRVTSHENHCLRARDAAGRQGPVPGAITYAEQHRRTSELIAQ